MGLTLYICLYIYILHLKSLHHFLVGKLRYRKDWSFWTSKLGKCIQFAHFRSLWSQFWAQNELLELAQKSKNELPGLENGCIESNINMSILALLVLKIQPFCHFWSPFWTHRPKILCNELLELAENTINELLGYMNKNGHPSSLGLENIAILPILDHFF